MLPFTFIYNYYWITPITVNYSIAISTAIKCTLRCSQYACWVTTIQTCSDVLLEILIWRFLFFIYCPGNILIKDIPIRTGIQRTYFPSIYWSHLIKFYLFTYLLPTLQFCRWPSKVYCTSLILCVCVCVLCGFWVDRFRGDFSYVLISRSLFLIVFKIPFTPHSFGCVSCTSNLLT